MIIVCLSLVFLSVTCWLQFFCNKFQRWIMFLSSRAWTSPLYEAIVCNDLKEIRNYKKEKKNTLLPLFEELNVLRWKSRLIIQCQIIQTPVNNRQMTALQSWLVQGRSCSPSGGQISLCSPCYVVLNCFHPSSQHHQQQQQQQEAPGKCCFSLINPWYVGNKNFHVIWS